MFDAAQLAALTAIHRRGSFEAAAALLGVTPSAISQRVKALEERAGCLLIRRGAPCRATEAGLRLIRHHDEVAALEAGVIADLNLQSEGRVTLRLAVNADSLATWVIPALAQVPDLLFDLEIDDQAHSQEWLRRGEVAAAVTSHPGPLQGCETLALGALRYRATASPEFMAREFAKGVTEAALARAPGLIFSDKDALQSTWITANFGREIAFPMHRLGSAQAFVEAAMAGLGWGMNPDLLTEPLFAAGELVELIPGRPLDVPLYWQFTRQSAAVLAPLTQALRATAQRMLVQPGPSAR